MPYSQRKRNKKTKPNDEYILEVDNLVKKYGNFTAVDGISFRVKKGSLFAFLGLNGAGKSTTINIITSILSKTSGLVKVGGYDLDSKPEDIKYLIGIVFQNSVLDPLLTPRENLKIRAGFYGIKGEGWAQREAYLIQMLNLSAFYNRPLGKLSGGQKRRVDIARAMIHDPKLLILDEPTTGLDPQTRLSVWNLVNSLREKTGMTVFLTTHYMQEAEKATDVVIMDKGKIIATGTPTELKNKYSSDYILLYVEQNEKIEKSLQNEGIAYTYNHDGRYYRVSVKDSTDAIAFLNSHQEVAGDFEVEKGSMDDVFLNVTGIRSVLEGGKQK